jgi:hypothetical protein
MYYKDHKILCQEILEQELKSREEIYDSPV